jgi:7-carboxy-7-deazaguanine synthase
MEFKTDALAQCLEMAQNGPHLSLKVVVFDEADYAFAKRVHELHPVVPFYLSVGNPSAQSGENADVSDLTARLEWLLARAARDGWFDATISPQLHVLLWGNKRGV